MAQQIDLHIRMLCLHGDKGCRKSEFLSCIPIQTCIADLKARIVKEQPAEEIELVHQGTEMKMHSALVEYDIVAAPVIDAIITVTKQKESIGLVDFEPVKPVVVGPAQFKDAMFCKKHCPKTETFNPSECIEQAKKERTKKAKLYHLKSRLSMGKTDDQVCHAMSIHIFAIVACDKAAVRTSFYLNMGPVGSCATIADIKESVRTLVDKTSADVELMLVSDRFTPLDDDRIFEWHALPSELSAIISF